MSELNRTFTENMIATLAKDDEAVVSFFGAVGWSNMRPNHIYASIKADVLNASPEDAMTLAANFSMSDRSEQKCLVPLILEDRPDIAEQASFLMDRNKEAQTSIDL